MRINHNVAALNTYSRLSQANGMQSKSLEKLSSGMRINRAGDDAAGLAISEKMRNQIKGLDQASRNAQDGISMIQTAEGALNETHAMLLRMRELVVQANNDTNDAGDRTKIQDEIGELISEINGIADKTQFNGKNLIDGTLGVKLKDGTSLTQASLTTAGISVEITGIASGAEIGFTTTASSITVTIDGTAQTIDSVAASATIAAGTTLNFDDVGVKISFSAGASAQEIFDAATLLTSGNTATLQIGANGGQTLDINIDSMRADAIGESAGEFLDDVNVEADAATQTFQQRLDLIDNAITDVSNQRSKLGAWQNRLEHTIANLTTSSENLTAAESRVRDVDMAKEMMEFTKNNILNQASTAMLAQANQQPQGVLQLLR